MQSRSVVTWLLRWRRVLQPLADVAAWVVALVLAELARYDFHPHHLHDGGLWQIVAVAAGGQLVFGAAFYLYRGRYRVGSFDEVVGLVATVVCTGTALLLQDYLAGSPHLVPISVPWGSSFAALVLMAGSRYSWRLVIERRRRPRVGRRLVVFGAGEGGAQVLLAMLRYPRSPYVPVALLDDDPAKQNLRIMGLRVLGDRRALPRVAAKFKAEAVLIAVPSADADLIRAVTAIAEGAGLIVKVLPRVTELLEGGVRVSDIRDIDLVDLLGRRPIDTDVGSIAHYLTGKRVLVTGAGGSIGSELCRQIARYDPARLVMLDRDESALHAVQLSITGRALLDSPDLVLADIRDVEHVNRIFDRVQPHVVFHAAALKHLPLLETYPGESVKTNVWGSLTVLQAAAEHAVERFVNISTDKAANPCSALGYSKRIAERLTAYVAGETPGSFLSVRFGNVLGSRGSVLTAFAAQVASGGPITVTDPEVTRFFMTVEEAVQLVIQAAAIGRDGEALVLDMGQPVRIADVARRLAEQSGKRIEVVFTGLRPGEKLHEDLFGDGEADERPIHPLISHVPVPPLDPVAALAIDPFADNVAVMAALRRASSSGVAGGVTDLTSAPQSSSR